jgi:hypothetical protein
VVQKSPARPHRGKGGAWATSASLDPHACLDVDCMCVRVCCAAPRRALCQYAEEWAAFIPEEMVGVRLLDGCSWLTNPTVMAVFQKRTGLVPHSQAVPDDKKAEFVHIGGWVGAGVCMRPCGVPGAEWREHGLMLACGLHRAYGSAGHMAHLMT